MKRVGLASSLVVALTLIFMPKTASAKAPTVRITISGGRLANSIELTDPQILEMSGAWSDEFLDSRNPVNEAPQESLAYEVSFYARIAENDVRKAYVIYYYPQQTGQGMIYLPGRGPVGNLNIAVIMRPGRDGKWNYASPAWEALVKRAIHRAEIAQRSRAETTGRTKTEQLPSRVWQVKVNDWRKPQAGWLYILDPRSESRRPGARVWLLAPDTGRTMGSISVGYAPDMALSADGRTLYVVSGERESGEIAVIDTASGLVRHVPFPDRVLYVPWYAALLPPFSQMKISLDGGVLGIMVPRLLSPGNIEYQLAMFDTRTNELIPERVPLGNCNYGQFASSDFADQFALLCSGPNGLLQVHLDAGYRQTSNTFVKLPWGPPCGVVEGFLSSDGSKLDIVRNDGAMYEIDKRAGDFHATPAVGNCVEPYFAQGDWPRSLDGTRAYLGYGELASNEMSRARELRRFETKAWREYGSVRTSVPFWSAVASRDGNAIYAVVPEHRQVLVIDANTLRETRAISIGITPALALVAR